MSDPSVSYDPTYPASIQDDDWSCSCTSTDWAMRALGRTPGPSYIEDLMLADGIVTKQYGLMNATGADLAAWIGIDDPAHYGPEGFYGNNEDSVTFDDLAAEIGPYPMLIGGRNWAGPGLGHWSGLRAYDAARDVLLLANPAGSGGSFGGQEMTRAQFNARGPFSMVRILHPDIDGSSATEPPDATTEPPVASSPPEMTATLPRGVDVASYQGYPHWPSVKAAGAAFAFAKVTEDTGYLNPTFAYNWPAIKAAGLVRGAYHFARPEGADAGHEADYFLDQIEAAGGLETGDILALDLESGSGDLGQWALDFLRRVRERAGYDAIVYTGAWFTSEHNMAAYPEFASYGLWLAAYQSTMPPPPPPFTVVAFWQFTSEGTVPGIVGNVDLNVFNGSADRIALYGKPADPDPEPEPSPPDGGSSFNVGPGILDKMADYEETPSSDEVFHGENAFSEAFDASGRRYVWVRSLGRCLVTDPTWS